MDNAKCLELVPAESAAQIKASDSAMVPLETSLNKFSTRVPYLGLLPKDPESFISHPSYESGSKLLNTNHLLSAGK